MPLLFLAVLQLIAAPRPWGRAKTAGMVVAPPVWRGQLVNGIFLAPSDRGIKYRASRFSWLYGLPAGHRARPPDRFPVLYSDCIAIIRYAPFPSRLNGPAPYNRLQYSSSDRRTLSQLLAAPRAWSCSLPCYQVGQRTSAPARCFPLYSNGAYSATIL
jgi:hypothetical protein